MSSNADQESHSPHGFDPLIQTENIAFDPTEMVACSRCHRNNPPNRLNCLYCASHLNLSPERAALIDPDLRQLEPWDRGVNIILRAVSKEADTKKASGVLSLDQDELVIIVDSSTELPIARVGNANEAESIIAKLRSLGFDCFSVSDDALATGTPNTRIGGIEFVPGEFGVKDFNTGQVTWFPTYKIAVIVEGVISKTTTDTIEKRRLRGESKLIDQTSIAADDRILDIYPVDKNTGYRVLPTGFDFSCLGEQKCLLARENWGRLAALLKIKLPSVKYVSGYTSIRPALEAVWPTESRNETKGMIQTGFGKREFGSVATTNNLEQFNRYSRLQRHLL